MEEANLETDAYCPGQTFLHKVFPYRGMIMHPWLAKVYDRDKVAKLGKDKNSSKNVPSKSRLYYQVLVDERDCSNIKAESLSVTFLSPFYMQRNIPFAQLYVIPGMDYVAHEDISPYTSTEKDQAIQHEMFEKFFAPGEDTLTGNGRRYVAKDELKSFLETKHPWLCMSNVYKETTENIRITVIPFYMGNQESYNKYWWRYCIRIENLGDEPVQLRSRHWKVFSNSFETIQGRGVVGKEPKLTKSSPAFQYSSHVSLESPTGYMWGTFTMEREDGTSFECKIPAFNLDRAEDGSGSNPDGTITN